MRDPNRITPMLQLLGALWRKNPDLRLGQLVFYAGSCDRDTDRDGNCPIHRAGCPADPFYIEDGEMQSKIKDKLLR